MDFFVEVNSIKNVLNTNVTFTHCRTEHLDLKMLWLRVCTNELKFHALRANGPVMEMLLSVFVAVCIAGSMFPCKWRHCYVKSRSLYAAYVITVYTIESFCLCTGYSWNKLCWNDEGAYLLKQSYEYARSCALCTQNQILASSTEENPAPLWFCCIERYSHFSVFYYLPPWHCIMITLCIKWLSSSWYTYIASGTVRSSLWSPSNHIKDWEELSDGRTSHIRRLWMLIAALCFSPMIMASLRHLSWSPMGERHSVLWQHWHWWINWTLALQINR
jgi:hypothetical protein